MENLNNCTIVITTFFSGKKIEECLKKIPDKFSKIIVDNGCEIEKKVYFEKKI